jgi:hypothetical protein
MFASEVLQHSAVFPTAEYLPIKPGRLVNKNVLLSGIYSTLIVGTANNRKVSGYVYGTLPGTSIVVSGLVEITTFVEDGEQASGYAS